MAYAKVTKPVSKVKPLPKINAPKKGLPTKPKKY